ncbi:glycosyltransferase [Enteractinococcus fodinae]|uniref:Glycosyltransferase involved in cell wall biosynthesis n=1 Tax=Enteractinococcus fodinae TaxID=684663 RepID=A0ABU2B328_9MICC|nr:glycosyltransferase [Enteractinococcus fodinae]MDR7347998.1 glycosyltransferase involved in cell wall biosynthesis [Enteractinococcus fodinae]
MSAAEWEPFLQTFNKITVLARVEPGLVRNEGYLLHERLEVVPIPYYSGVVNYYRKRAEILDFIFNYIADPEQVYYMWVPTQIAGPISKKVKEIGAALILRVIGDPAGVAKSILPTPANHLAARIEQRKLRRTVQYADGIIYVTLRTLQELYPPSQEALVQARTDVVFSPELLAITKKRRHDAEKDFSIIAVGSQQQNYKGHDLLIKAVGSLQKRGYDISLTLVGQGAKHEELRSLAKELQVKGAFFIERLGFSLDVARYVSTFDMFAMPSRTEGMPKALLEAMAVGVLSIGSSVGGIPEILEEECLFEPNSVSALEERIAFLIENRDLAEEQRELQSEKIALIHEHYSGNQVIENFLESFLNQKVYR